MNETMRTISFDLMAIPGPSEPVRVLRPVGTAEAEPQTLPGRPTLRERVRAISVRTTLGPTRGDHVLGEGQWSSRTVGHPTR